MEIRNELPADVPAISAVTEEAFKEGTHNSHTEHFIVDALRKANALTLSLVAEIDGTVIGHVAVSPVSISDGSKGWYGLGPISVIPEFQKQGIGSSLMRRALAELKNTGAKGCVVLGDPDYYVRFDFKAESGIVFPGVPPGYFQVLSFSTELPQGEVTYHDAFNAQG